MGEKTLLTQPEQAAERMLWERAHEDLLREEEREDDERLRRMSQTSLSRYQRERKRLKEEARWAIRWKEIQEGWAREEREAAARKEPKEG